MKKIAVFFWLIIQMFSSNSQGVKSVGAIFSSDQGSFLNLLDGANLVFENHNSTTGGASFNGILNLTGNLTNNTTTENIISAGNGAINLIGNSTQTIGGNTKFIVQQINVDNSNGAELSNNLDIESNLKLSNGILSLKDFNLKIVDGASITDYSSVDFINAEENGGLLMYLSVGGSQITFPVGTSTSYTPAYLTLNSGTSQYFYVSLLDGVWSEGTTGTNLALSDPVVNRTWIIRGDLSHDVDLAMQWNGTDEVNGFDRTTAFYNQYDSQWLNYNATVSGSDPYLITYEGITDLNSIDIMAVSAESNPLPIDLLYFKGIADEINNHLEWATASERISSSFEIWKSNDKQQFKHLASMPASQNSNSLQFYEFNDYDCYTGVTYYKLMEIDINGTNHEFPMIELARKQNNTISICQSGESLQFNFSENNSGSKILRIYDLVGNLIYVQNFNTSPEKQEYKIALPSLSSGIYIYLIEGSFNPQVSGKFIWN